MCVLDIFFLFMILFSITGTVTVVVPLYIAEISPTNLRGAMGTCHQLMVTIGILLGQVGVTFNDNIMYQLRMCSLLKIVM